MEASGGTEPQTKESKKTVEDITTTKMAAEKEKLTELTETMFNDVAAYIQGELTVTSEDYKLLEKMNRITAKKYQGYTSGAKEMVDSMESLQEKCEGFKPYLEQIDQLDASVDELEETVKMLDIYTKKLDERFRAARRGVSS